MNRIYTFGLFLLLSSCSLSSNGKIEIREICSYSGDQEFKNVYLINNSTSKIITFTVKVTEQLTRISKQPDLPQSSRVEVSERTRTKTLSPGEILHLGCTGDRIENNISSNWKSIQLRDEKYEIVGAVEVTSK